MDIDRLKTQLMVDEGVRLDAYKCPAGYLTVGAGRNLDTNPLTPDETLVVGHDGRTKSITREQASYLLSADIDRVVLALDKLIPWWSDLDEVRKRVLINMAFNLGPAGLMKFTVTLGLVRTGHYTTASITMLQSTWANQVGARATRLSKAMQTGLD